MITFIYNANFESRQGTFAILRSEIVVIESSFYARVLGAVTN